MSVRNLNVMRSADDVRSVADRLGSPMFSPSTMAFFGSRLLNFHARIDDDSGYIVTSDMSPSGRSYALWKYTVTRENWTRESDGYVEERDVISFDQVERYDSARDARKVGKELAQ